MNKQRPLLLIILLLYIFTPELVQWITATDGHWYRPFIVWLLVIFVAFLLQGKEKNHDL